MGTSYWERMYEKPVSDIPWEIEKPPRELVDLVEKGELMTGRTLDIACGTGNYAIYLAKHGFKVTGIDISSAAINLAKEKAKQAGVHVTFIQADCLSPPALGLFDFILDYSFLHHVPHEKTAQYARTYAGHLAPEGKLLLVCYSEKDSGGKPMLEGRYGNTMYYRTKEEVEEAYAMLRVVSYAPATLGKQNHHVGHAFVFEKS